RISSPVAMFTPPGEMPECGMLAAEVTGVADALPAGMDALSTHAAASRSVSRGSAHRGERVAPDMASLSGPCGRGPSEIHPGEGGLDAPTIRPARSTRQRLKLRVAPRTHHSGDVRMRIRCQCAFRQRRLAPHRGDCRRTAVCAYTSAHSSSRRNETCSLGPCE